MSRSGNPAKRAWQPMEQGILNPVMADLRDGTKEAWSNDLYQATVAYDERSGPMCISFKRHDRAAVRDWRHFQQIKNDIAGPEREAVELFPAESRLMDTANQYWLWVAGEGVRWPLGMDKGAVTDDEQVESVRRSKDKGQQRAWQPGLTTGRTDKTPFVPDSEWEELGRVVERSL